MGKQDVHFFFYSSIIVWDQEGDAWLERAVSGTRLLVSLRLFSIDEIL